MNGFTLAAATAGSPSAILATLTGVSRTLANFLLPQLAARQRGSTGSVPSAADVAATVNAAVADASSSALFAAELAALVAALPPSPPPLNGVAVDGYLAGCDLTTTYDGAVASSDTSGAFLFSPAPRYGSIRVAPSRQCLDSLTGIPLSTASQGLSSPVTSVRPLVVSPFTTLIQAVVDAHAGYDALGAQALVASALGLQGLSSQLLSYDPVGG